MICQNTYLYLAVKMLALLGLTVSLVAGVVTATMIYWAMQDRME